MLQCICAFEAGREPRDRAYICANQITEGDLHDPEFTALTCATQQARQGDSIASKTGGQHAVRVYVTWILDGRPQLTEDGTPKHGPQEHIEDIPEEEELADAAVQP